MILSYISSTFQLIIPSQWCWFVLIIFISVPPSTPNHHCHFRNIFLILLHSQKTNHPLLILLQLSLCICFFLWYLKATEIIPLFAELIYDMFQVTCLSVFFHYSYLTLCPMYWVIGRMSSFPVNIFPILFCTLILEISILPR